MSDFEKRVILHLYANPWPYHTDPEYEVIRVEETKNFTLADKDYAVSGIVASPNYSTEEGPDLWRVFECIRIIEEAQMQGTLDWFVIENPANDHLRDFLGDPTHSYQPWQYGDPCTELTDLWGDFTIPPRLFTDRNSVQMIPQGFAHEFKKHNY